MLRMHRIAGGWALAALLAGCAALPAEPPVPACPDRAAMAIAHPEKIGIGGWELAPPGVAAERIAALGVAWHYVWGPDPLAGGRGGAAGAFVPMVWGRSQLAADPAALSRIARSDAVALLGFNEPDRPDQAHMDVRDALHLWYALAATGKRLGSPAVSQGATLGEVRWLPRFMAGVAATGLRVDFVAVHYYAGAPDVAAFRGFLDRVHAAYGLPIWVTEWGLVDPATWRDGRARYDAEAAACFFRAGAAMLDDLDFVERHAWFAAFDGGDGWHLNTHAVAEDGSLTPVGRAIAEATGTQGLVASGAVAGSKALD